MENPYENNVSEIGDWIDSEDSRPMNFQELKVISSHIINKQRNNLSLKIYKNYDVSSDCVSSYTNRIISDYIFKVINFIYNSFNNHNDETIKNQYVGITDKEIIGKLIMNLYILKPTLMKNQSIIEMEFNDEFILNGRNYAVGLTNERTNQRYHYVKDIIEEIYENEFTVLRIDGETYSVRFKYLAEDIMMVLLKIG